MTVPWASESNAGPFSHTALLSVLNLGDSQNSGTLKFLMLRLVPGTEYDMENPKKKERK